MKVGGKALTRKFKPIPNKSVRQMIEQYCPDGFDGEIICPNKTFNETQSLIMSEDGNPHFEYIVFDYVKDDVKKPYRERLIDLQNAFHQSDMISSIARPLLPIKIDTLEFLQEYESDCIADGFEGVMVRTPDSPYKNGRSTVREGFLLKIKRFADSEAEVIGFEERLKNNNELQKDELGHAKRSSHKANLTPAGTLGTLLVRDVTTGLEFGIGTGFDDATRLEIWNNREKYLGKFVTYQYQPSGMKDLPRFPSFKGFRSKDDMS